MSFEATKQLQPLINLKAKGGTTFAKGQAVTFENGLIVPASGSTAKVFFTVTETVTTPAGGSTISCMPTFAQPIYEDVPLKKVSGTVTQALVGTAKDLKDSGSVDFNTGTDKTFFIFKVDIEGMKVSGIFINGEA